MLCLIRHFVQQGKVFGNCPKYTNFLFLIDCRLFLTCVLGPLEESAIWIDEIPLEEMHRANHGHSITQISGYQDPLGITKDIR